MFERIFPFAVTVGGFSITTKFSRVSLAPWTLARPVSPPDVAAAAGVSEECVLVTVPHAAHRTAVDPAAYANIDRHPSHRAYAISRPLADRRAASANKSNGSRIDSRLALAAATSPALTASLSRVDDTRTVAPSGCDGCDVAAAQGSSQVVSAPTTSSLIDNSSQSSPSICALGPHAGRHECAIR